MPLRSLRILLADEDRQALEGLATTLRNLGHEVSSFAVSVGEAVALVTEHDPDATVVVVHRDTDHALALIGEAGEYASGPVIAQMAAPDPAVAAAAADRGVAAVIEQGTPEALQSALEVAVRRRQETAALEDRVGRLESAFERRATIERAKGILMERHSIGDAESFSLLRDHARSQSRSVVDVAQAVIDGHALLPARADGR